MTTDRYIARVRVSYELAVRVTGFVNRRDDEPELTEDEDAVTSWLLEVSDERGRTAKARVDWEIDELNCYTGESDLTVLENDTAGLPQWGPVPTSRGDRRSATLGEDLIHEDLRRQADAA